jgi:hypothetical protein
MKIKCVKCENEFGATKDRIAKMIEKGMTIETYECRECRVKKTVIAQSVECSCCHKTVSGDRKRIAKIREAGAENYKCRSCRPKKEKPVKVKKERKAKQIVEPVMESKSIPLRDAKGRFIKKAA